MNLEKFPKSQRPEVLAPVGNREMFRAAVHAGADAVYIGMPGYNARARTEDFSFDDLREIIEEAHLYQVRVLVAFNILIFQDELEAVRQDLRSLLEVGPDAIIVQDIGLVRMIRKMCPAQKVHASTQMTVTHHMAIELLEDLNLQRFVLGREVSMSEMALLRQHSDAELEVFVHGALCVAYSGQCLTSESFGGRSANRGQCAQSCRLPYDLIVDGEKRDMGPRKHLVSPKDLCGLDDVPELVNLGIDSFKIEGRYKSPEYVATTSSAYRKAVDGVEVDEDHRFDMEVSFSRGFFKGWLHGVDHNQLVDGIRHAHRGKKMGRLLSWSRDGGVPKLRVSLERDPEAGDSLMFCSPLGEILVGGKVYESRHLKASDWELAMAKDFDLSKLKGKKLEVYCQRSPSRDRSWQRIWKDRQLGKKIAIELRVEVMQGVPMGCEARWGEGQKVKVYSESPVQEAQKRALDEVGLQKTLGAWGGSCFEVEKWNWELGEACFLPMGEVKRCRQKLQEAMEAAHGTPQIELAPEPELLTWIKNEEVSASADVQQAEAMGGNSEACYLRVLVRDPLQLEALNGLDVCEVILDYRHGVAYGPSVKKVREMGMKVCVATTRIVKPGEERRLLDLLKLLPDSVLVRNLAALQFLHHHAEDLKVPLWGDFSLNICNHLSSQYFLNKGLDYWLPSYDLNLQQLESLLAVVDVGKVELTLHQTMPSFHMEHCVFATFLSEGSDISNCGMVCRKHDLALEDAKGIRHPLLADKECRNTMFNGVPQSVASLIPNFQNAGVRHFRFEALVEEGEVLREKVQGYLKVLRGQMTGTDLKARLGLKESFGVTEGQVLSDRVHIPRKKSSS